jgi:hypothetical protein
LGQLTNLVFIRHSPSILVLFNLCWWVYCIIAGAMANHLDVGALVPATAAGHLWQANLAQVSGTFGRYRVRLAQDGTDRIAACRLRFNVFNVELGEGLSSSYSTGLDRDRFDASPIASVRRARHGARFICFGRRTNCELPSLHGPPLPW